MFPSYDLLRMKENSQGVHTEFQRRTLLVWTAIARPARKFQLNISSHIHSACVIAKCWTSLTAVVQTVDCRCHLIQKYKGFKSQEWPGHAVDPPRPVQCSVNTLFKSSQTARRKCGGTPCYMNHKWIIGCRTKSCNSSRRTFRSKSW